MRARGPDTSTRRAGRLALIAGLVLGLGFPAWTQTVRQTGLLDSGGLPLRWDVRNI